MRYVSLIMAIAVLYLGFELNQSNQRIAELESRTIQVYNKSDDNFNQFMSFIERMVILEHSKQEGTIENK